ncbi:class I SAM-dependent methyltransferase [Desulfovibrio subterraneus]|jgi:SAM-dependent methyltransferase|uniref:Methyltransferase n=1 Tax=Desulfovibrio subterraneus TaxID=2718620 RepID=A0A7J0BL08_9BACT|nr:class I SAM-dependent methyltransferase [Desulfovibrio subterraneus]WBF68053.1 class I SAM-dependent methyltransferase [Desulfovibrio subterraneus]GFM33931.1 methyltransferase [Desulfovibrio subterraneus]
MRNPDENGWVSSSAAWLDRMPERGDFAREFILDTPMMDRVKKSGAATMLDVGCGDGRFCRMAERLGIITTGIDPVEDFLHYARQTDPCGRYLTGFAEDLPFGDAEFDLVVFYLTLIDINDVRAAIREAARVTKPKGTILVANLTSFYTSNGTTGWVEGADGREYHPLGNYLEERADWVEWDGLRIRNWHRPLCVYMSAFLDAGLQLTFYDEPAPSGGPQERISRYHMTPFTMMMEWRRC